MPDGVVAVLSFLEDAGDGEGHEAVGGEREIEGKGRDVVLRLRQVLQEGEDAQPA